jgi:ketosteroid isomerase-like protein
MTAPRAKEAPVSEQQNIETLKQAYAAFGRGDMDALLNVFDENVKWITPGPEDLPTAGQRTGRQEVADFFRIVDELFEFQRFEPKEFLADGDRVVVLGEDTVRVKATGGVLDAAWAHVSTLSGGKVVHFQEYSDVSALVAELRAATARV